MEGGLAAVSDQKVLASLPLSIAGLMAEISVREVHPERRFLPRPKGLGLGAVEWVKDRLDNLHDATKALGCKLPDPFMILSFLSLPVIPELKITDKGLVDVNQFKIVPLFGEE
jgi:adenine deaminase